MVGLIFFFFNDTATTEIYTLSLHDALPIFVQVFPGPELGLRTVPEAQVPPVIEKAPVPAVLVMVGAAVRVNGLAAAPLAVLVTVTTPFFVVGVAGHGVIARTGPAHPNPGPRTA